MQFDLQKEGDIYLLEVPIKTEDSIEVNSEEKTATRMWY